MAGFTLAAVLSAMCMGQAGPPERSTPETWSSYGRYGSWDGAWDMRGIYVPPSSPKVPVAMAEPPGTSGSAAKSQRPPSGKHYGPSHVRRDLSTLTDDSPTMKSLRKGIEAMKKLPADDPHNWNNWSNIHSFPTDTPNPDSLWGQCQHGNWWFFPWHRAYLVYFERIIRRYSEDPSFALPYWDCSLDRTLPAAYRDADSTLFDDSRRNLVNNGTDSLNPLVVVLGTDLSMNHRFFSDFGAIMTFGGRALDTPQHRGHPHGAPEAIPHDLVHVFVGGNMSTADLAARDPIFFAHHANVDRLWVAWLQMGQGRANPSNDVWLNQKFTFYDENKRRVTVAVRDLLDTAALGYVYDRSPSPADAPSRPTPQTAVETVATLRTPNTSLQNQPVTLTLKPAINVHKSRLVIGSKNRADFKSAPLATQHFHLLMEEVSFLAPDSVVAVYLNLPPNTPIPGPLSPYYAGCFTFFGDHGHPDGMASQVERHTQSTAGLDEATAATARDHSDAGPHVGRPGRARLQDLVYVQSDISFRHEIGVWGRFVIGPDNRTNYQSAPQEKTS